MTRLFYTAGIFAPFVFLASVLIGAARWPGYAHLADPVSALGMRGAPDAWAVNSAWTVTGVLVMGLAVALWRDKHGPGRLAAGAVMLAGAASAAIAIGFPMDPPGVPPSFSQLGHNYLVAVTAAAFAIALIAAARSDAAPRVYQRLTWAALAMMVLGGVGAGLSSATGQDWIGGFERVTQCGYHGWILLTAVTGMMQGWRGASLWRLPPAHEAVTAARRRAKGETTRGSVS